MRSDGQVSTQPDEMAFVPLGPEHYDLMRSWLAAPHMRDWWGDPDEEFGYIRDMVEGRDSTRPFIIALDGRPVGLIECWFIGHHQNETWIVDHAWLAELPADAVGVDLSIGEAELLSQGIGSMALAAFVRGLHAQGYRTIIIDPDPANTRAVRACYKAGVRPVPSLQGRTGATLIMQFDPNANEAP